MGEFDSSAYAPRLGRATEAELALVDRVRRTLGRVGTFQRRGDRLVFVWQRPHRVVPVSRVPTSAFSKIVAAVVGLSPRLPALQRALDVVLAEARELVGADAT